jgi:hypothetical protein
MANKDRELIHRPLISPPSSSRDVGPCYSTSDPFKRDEVRSKLIASVNKKRVKFLEKLHEIFENGAELYLDYLPSSSNDISPLCGSPRSLIHQGSAIISSAKKKPFSNRKVLNIEIRPNKSSKLYKYTKN